MLRDFAAHRGSAVRAGGAHGAEHKGPVV